MLLNESCRQSNEANSHGFKSLLSFLVCRVLCLVNLSINLDCQPLFRAVEIKNKAIHRVLPAKLQASEAITAKRRPKHLF